MMRLRLLLGGLILAVLLVFGLWINRYYSAPDFSLPVIQYYKSDGIAAQVTNLKNPLMVIFAASWCVNCVEELQMVNAYPALDSSRVLVLSDESWPKIQRLKRLAPRLQYGKSKVSFSALQIHAIPCAYVFSPQGRLLKKQNGTISWNDPSTRNYYFTLLHLQCPQSP